MKYCELPSLRENISDAPESGVPLPNEFMDFVMPRLSGAELRLMFFLFGRAWRTDKPVVVASLSQLLNGSITLDGEIYDRGCGLKNKAAVLGGIKGLVGRGLITKIRMRSYDGGDSATAYALHSGVYEAGGIAELSGPITPILIPIPGKKQRQVSFGSRRAWQAIKELHGDRCVDCGRGEPEVELTRDHIIPTSKGGPNIAGNIAPRCRSCNSRKGARMNTHHFGDSNAS